MPAAVFILVFLCVIFCVFGWVMMPKWKISHQPKKSEGHFPFWRWRGCCDGFKGFDGCDDCDGCGEFSDFSDSSNSQRAQQAMAQQDNPAAPKESRPTPSLQNLRAAQRVAHNSTGKIQIYTQKKKEHVLITQKMALDSTKLH